MSTALVPVASIDQKAPAEHGTSRPRANFLAQLIATSAQAPQTRARRRAEPDVAIAAYAGGADRQPPAPAGRTVSRSF